MPVLKTINKTKVPILIYTTQVESEAIDDAIAIANLLPIYHHLAFMADMHKGKGKTIPIGGVMPLDDAICPMGVGADIGCGMYSFRLNLAVIDLETQKKIFSLIRQCVPLGMKHQKSQVRWEGFDVAPVVSPIVKQELDSARLQLGTLGGGNHFIEFQKGSDGYIWVTIHCGSRNLGSKIADYYHKVALERGENHYRELPYLSFAAAKQKHIAEEYEEAMNFALRFALKNREVIANAVISCIQAEISSARIEEVINIHHNYAVRETHFGKEVVLHRKGATLASQGTIGVIPGSQGTNSYIVRGLGNADSFRSCSHGAGRTMSRAKAKEILSVEDCQRSMQEKGLLVDFKRGNLDEALEAYKDIEQVMANQDDLVEIVTTLTPYQIAAIKDGESKTWAERRKEWKASKKEA